MFAAAWIVMCVGYSYSGYTKLVSPSWVDGTALARVLSNPLARPTWLRDVVLAVPDSGLRLATWGALGLELAFLPIAIFRRARRWVWTAMLGMHVGLMLLIDFAELSFGMVVLHLFTFNPQWVPNRWPDRRDQLFYDGTCGLCHRATRFILSEDRRGTAFTFAALNGGTYLAAIAPEQRAGLPDSLVVRTEDGTLLTRTDAGIYMLERLGGFWRLIAVGLWIVPRVVRDIGYAFIARIRYRLFSRPESTCPLLPPDLRSRFHG